MLKAVQIVSRVILGLIYFFFGGMGLSIALGLYHPEFPPMTPGADAFFKGIMMSGYFFPLLKATETICGFFVLFNIGTPLALVILAPITLHILLFHAFLTPGASNLYLPAVMVLCHVLAASAYAKKYRSLLSND